MRSSPHPDVGAALDAAVHEYRQRGDVGALLDRVKAVVREAPTEALGPAAAPYMDLPEVVIPVYERIVELSPTEAQPMVVLANAYWLSGRGAEVVGQLAERAKSVDDGNRGAWHLWALAESDPRRRMERWRAVTQRFPADQLARAALAGRQRGQRGRCRARPTGARSGGSDVREPVGGGEPRRGAQGARGDDHEAEGLEAVAQGDRCAM
jgi:hypothetical protein